ncbi:low-density lipoprotein receptor-related protein 4-like [Mya arenaria]|uniref:low-density lipoprotein receptor-related protein 4-like n=1 Tax=Mya arenaria TaxID=6604 RepID=UPI0022E760B5|nr:low-density lipoprotein receptor-related protein 4-like [Mya arenaria]XP_052816819.1 low-density lipoprotein receptor-related protein 4-like [Mya arenaria]XP_052816820.1 low-density lipoprotein receptor-related protein 4-like [Mya arenaria]XP_052816821.1 low-density lipoprotein receptor-related protein 4-like [Mya arenaria]
MSTLALYIAVMIVGSSMSQTTEEDKEMGLIFTGWNHQKVENVHFWHLQGMPGYGNFSLSVQGLLFNYPYNHYLSLDVDYREKVMYAYNTHLRTIDYVAGYTADYKNIGDFDFFHEGLSSSTIQVALDWISHTLYWTDSGYRWILAAAALPEKINSEFYKVIVETNLDAPDGLAIDPLDAFLFWSDNGEHPKIERSNLLGGQRKTLITSRLANPLSLEADLLSKRIFWIDSITENIESATYDGEDRKIIKRIVFSILFDLAIYRDVVVVTDISDDLIMFYNKTSGARIYDSLYLDSGDTTYGVATYFKEDQPIRETDHCLSLNCDHMCITTEESAVCACSEGYMLNPDSHTCDEVSGGQHRAIIFANATQICLTDIRHANLPFFQCDTAFVTGSTNEQIRFLDVDMHDRVMYFVVGNSTIYQRPVDLPKENSAKMLLHTTSGIIMSLAFDWVDKLLFWSELDGSIFLLSTETSESKTLTNKTSNPQNVAVLAHDRSIVWTDDGGIKTMAIDASSGPTVIKPASTAIRAITVDYDRKLIYWIQADDVIGSIHINGEADDTKLPSKIQKGAYLIELYKEKLTWVFTSSSGNTAYATYDRSSGKDLANITHDIQNVVAMKYLDPSLQRNDTSPCAHENGGCEQICVTHHTDSDIFMKKCECEIGYTLHSDSATCNVAEPVGDNFILVFDATYEEVRQIDMSTLNHVVIPLPEPEFVYGIHYDPLSTRMLWSQANDFIVHSMLLNGSNYKEMGYTLPGSARCLTIDETTKNIYYTTYPAPGMEQQHVGLIAPSGHNIKLVDVSVEDRLGNIAVHPKLGLMFYTVLEFTGSVITSYVAKANMDGTQVTRIISSVDGMSLGTPDGVAIDYQNDMLYWSDSYRNKIQRCNLDGTLCVTIVDLSDEETSIRDLVFDGTNLYFTDYAKDSVTAFNVSANSTKQYGSNFGRLRSLDVYKSNWPNVQPVNSLCSPNGGIGDCSSICVPAGTGRVCMCEEGEHLQEDGRSCGLKYHCDKVIVQEEGVIITFDQYACSRLAGAKCEYFCPYGYSKANKSINTLQCRNDGWTPQFEMLCVKSDVLECPVSTSNLQNVAVDKSCKDISVGSACAYQCNTGFQKKYDGVVCRVDQVWHPTDACTEIKCHNLVENGYVPLDKCDFMVNSECNYVCGGKGVYEQSKTVTKVKCLQNGQWNQTDVCLEVSGSSAPLSEKSSDGISKAGAITGIILLILVIIALVAVIFFVVRRMQSSKSPYSASYHGRSGTTAIENPGYGITPSATPAPQRRESDNQPYSGSDLSQQEQVTFEPLPGNLTVESEGMVNPLYGANDTSDQRNGQEDARKYQNFE